MMARQYANIKVVLPGLPGIDGREPFTSDQVGGAQNSVINIVHAISANVFAKVKNAFSMPSLAMAVA